MAELCIHRRLRIGENKKRLVEVVDSAQLQEPLLDECLEMVAQARQRERTEEWVLRFSFMRNLCQQIASSLCSHGILRGRDARVCLFFKRRLYEIVDHSPRQLQIDLLHSAIFGSSVSMDLESRVLVALANQGGLLTVHLSKSEVGAHERRIKEIERGHVLSVEAAKAVRAARQIYTVIAVSSGSAARTGS